MHWRWPCSATAASAVSDADKCESSELKTSGKYGFCRLKEDAKAVKTGDPPDYSKCDAKFGDKFGQADTDGMGACPSSATQTEIQLFITQCTNDVAAALGGAPLPVCQPPPLQTGQTTAYGTGSDGDLQKGASQSFTDNGDGTITDNTTGLMWEKKSDDGTINDWDNTYTWCGASCGTYEGHGRHDRHDVPGDAERRRRLCRTHGLADSECERAGEHPEPGEREPGDVLRVQHGMCRERAPLRRAAARSRTATGRLLPTSSVPTSRWA